MNQSLPKKKQTKPNDGFIVVATREKSFVLSALNLRDSLFDFWPDAKISLYTEPRFIKDFGDDLDTFDNVIPVGDSEREKMLGMYNSPYDRTMYLDADCEINHKDITSVFDHLDDGSDMYWVELTDEAKRCFVMHRWGTGDIDKLTHCGGVCLYKSSNPLVKEFMKDWYDIYHLMIDGKWGPKELPDVPREFMQWDQTVLWYLIHKEPKYKSLKWKYFSDNYRWNYYTSMGNVIDQVPGKWRFIPGDKPPVIIHYSNVLDKKGNKGILI